MVDYTVIDAYGSPRRWGQCDAELLAEQASAGESVVVGVPPSPSHAWDGQQWAERPPRPSSSHTWESGAWQDTRTLESAKSEAWERVKSARAAHIDAGLSTPYGVFQTAPPERQNIVDAVLLAQTLNAMGQPVSIQFTLTDNSVVTLGITEMVTVGLLLGQRVQEAHAIGRTLRAEIDAAQTIEEADAVAWPQE